MFDLENERILASREHAIECRVEKMVDRLDKRYMNGEFDESVYQHEMRKIDAWANAQFAALV